MRRNTNSKQLAFRVPERVRDDLESLAHGRNLSEVVRDALVQYIKANTPMVNVKRKD